MMSAQFNLAKVRLTKGARKVAFKANSKAVFSIIGVMIILAATGFLSSSLANSSSNPGCVGQGACVLYFYANW